VVEHTRMKKRGAVALSFEAIASMLHLRAGLSVIGAKVNPNDETVEFFLAGDNLPPTARGAPIVRYNLTQLMDQD